MNNEERVMIFIDGSNLYHIIKEMFKDKNQRFFNFSKFIEKILGNRKLVRTYYYNCALDIGKNIQSYMNQQRFFDKLGRIQNFKIILCRMQKVKVNGKIIYQVKEDDIHLAVDMVKLAYKNAYDTAILVSSDGDFAPAVNAIQETGKKVENIGFEKKFSYHLQKECDCFRKLKIEEIKDFFD